MEGMYTIEYLLELLAEINASGALSSNPELEQKTRALFINQTFQVGDTVRFMYNTKDGSFTVTRTRDGVSKTYSYNILDDRWVASNTSGDVNSTQHHSV